MDFRAPWHRAVEPKQRPWRIHVVGVMLWEQQLGVYSEAGLGEDFFPDGWRWQPVRFHREIGKADVGTESAVAVAEAWN